MRPVAAVARPGLGLSAEAVACAPQTTGLMLTIDPLGSRAAEPVEKTLELGMFTAMVRCGTSSSANTATRLPSMAL